jgi:hypothetical protein
VKILLVMQFTPQPNHEGESMAARNVKGLKFTAQEVQANWAKALANKALETKKEGKKVTSK